MYRPTHHQPTLHSGSAALHDLHAAAAQAVNHMAHGAQAQRQRTLHVRLLAGLQLMRDGAPVTTLPHGRSRSLLKLLLLKRHRPTGRTRLCQLFFPDLDPASARGHLNATVHRLRRSLDGVLALRHAADAYQLEIDRQVWLDVEEFERHAELGHAADVQGDSAQAITHYDLAAELYRADLDESGAHGEPGEPALASDCQALRARLNQVLERLATLREINGDLHGSLRAGQRHLSLDECNEAAHRRLMRCYAGLGQLQLAERQYRACIATIRSELALSPAEETTAEYRRVIQRMCT
jgi:DNA-binding SARP family transcriptional activator